MRKIESEHGTVDKRKVDRSFEQDEQRWIESYVHNSATKIAERAHAARLALQNGKTET